MKLGKLKRFSCVFISALLVFGAFGCGKDTDDPGGPIEPPEPEIEYKTLTFEHNDELVFHTDAQVTDADLVRGITIRDEIGVTYTPAVVDKAGLNVGVKTGTGAPYEITVGAKDEKGEWVKKDAETNWTAARKVHVRSVDFDFMIIEGAGVLNVDAGEPLTESGIIAGLSVKDETTGEDYYPSVVDAGGIDTFAPGSTVYADITLRDAAGHLLMESADDVYTMQREIRVGGLYYIEVAKNNGDKGPWGSREELLGLTDEQAAKITGRTAENQSFKLPIRESNVVELTSNGGVYPINNSDPLGARLFINNNTAASRTINVLGGSGIAVNISFDGAVVSAYDGLSGRNVSSANTPSSGTERETAPNAALKPYGAGWSVPARSMALFISNENLLGGADHDSTTNGCQFVLRNIANEYRNYVRVYKGGDGFAYETSEEKLTGYPEDIQDIRLYGDSGTVQVDVAYPELTPDENEVKAMVIAGVRLLVNYAGAGGKAGWNLWESAEITADDVTVPTDYSVTGVTSAREYGFDINVSADVHGQAITRTITRNVRVFNSKPDGAAFDLYIDDVSVRYLVPGSGNNTLYVNEPRAPLRFNGGSDTRSGLFTYGYFWDGEGEERTSKLWSLDNSEGNYFSSAAEVTSGAQHNIGSNAFAVMFDPDGMLKAIFSPVGAVGVIEIVDGTVERHLAGNANVVGEYVPQLIEPGDIVLVCPNGVSTGNALRNFFDTNTGTYNGRWDFMRDLNSASELLGAVRLVIWNMAVPDEAYNGQVEYKNAAEAE